jgi:MFS family permease
LLIAAFAGPAVGRIIDRYGGRGVLVLSNLVFAGGLTALAATNGALGLVAAWMVLGVGMALGLYDAGFATLAALYGHKARGPITGTTFSTQAALSISSRPVTCINSVSSRSGNS